MATTKAIAIAGRSKNILAEMLFCRGERLFGIEFSLKTFQRIEWEKRKRKPEIRKIRRPKMLKVGEVSEKITMGKPKVPWAVRRATGSVITPITKVNTETKV
jgi:hypothetical protein